MTIIGNKVTAGNAMWLVKDNVWAKFIFLGVNDAVENWREATQAEYEEAHPMEPEPSLEDEATIEDYESALGRFGV